MSEELKPCPFCGEPSVFQHDYHEDEHRYPRDFWHVRIWCDYCCQGTEWQAYGQQEARKVPENIKSSAESRLAVEWNTRPIEDTLRARAAELESLVRDAIEDETEFETEWNKQARAALASAKEK